MPGGSFYAVAKAGIHALTQRTCKQLPDSSVKVFAVLPLRLATNLNKDLGWHAAGGTIFPEETTDPIANGLADDTQVLRIGLAAGYSMA